ncbi:MAG: hypothetical protein ABEI07_00380 [Candidatus Nanohaloarchaea archaeon]
MIFCSGERLLIVAAILLGISSMATAAPNVDILSVDAPSFVEPGETAEIIVKVKNTAGHEVHQMEVKAEGFDQVKEANLWSLSAGEEETLQFYLDAPEAVNGTHEIDITVQSRDEDGNVIGGEKRTVEIDVGESGVIAEPDESGLRIEQVVMPATALAGQKATFDVTVRNTGSSDTGGLHVTVKAFGMTVTEDAGTVEGESSRIVQVKVPVPAASRGREEVRIEASTFRAHTSMNATLSISDVRATLNLRDKTVKVGEHVTVSGLLSQRNTRAELFYGGNFLAPVFSDETGYYTHTIIPRQPGVYSVRISVGTGSVEKFLTVEPRIEVQEVSAPDRVATGSIFEVCGRVSRSTAGETTVELRVDGKVREVTSVAVSGSAEKCFSLSLGSEGNHTVKVSAISAGITSSRQKQVRAVDTGVSASVFPDQMTLTRGQAGVFQIRIDNDRLKGRTFQIEVSGLNISMQKPGDVSLRRGQTHTSFVRVVPQRTGRFEGSILVSSDGNVLTESDVTVLVVENPALRNPVTGGVLRSALEAMDTFTELRQRQKWAVLAVAALIVLALVWIWRRRRRSEVIEPQY